MKKRKGEKYITPESVVHAVYHTESKQRLYFFIRLVAYIVAWCCGILLNTSPKIWKLWIQVSPEYCISFNTHGAIRRFSIPPGETQAFNSLKWTVYETHLPVSNHVVETYSPRIKTLQDNTNCLSLNIWICEYQ